MCNSSVLYAEGPFRLALGPDDERALLDRLFRDYYEKHLEIRMPADYPRGRAGAEAVGREWRGTDRLTRGVRRRQIRRCARGVRTARRSQSNARADPTPQAGGPPASGARAGRRAPARAPDEPSGASSRP